MEKEILLISGGLDSFILWLYLDKIKSVYCKLNHKYQKKELDCLHKLKKETGLAFVEDESLNLGRWEELDSYILHRNLLMASIASHYGDKIYIGGVKGDRVSDNTTEAHRLMSEALTKLANDRKIEVTAPFVTRGKEEVVKWFLDKGYPEKWLNISVSCFSIENGQCGECPACFRKWIALEYNGIEMVSKKPVREWKGIEGYIERIKKGLYDLRRTQVTLEVLRKNGWKI